MKISGHFNCSVLLFLSISFYYDVRDFRKKYNSRIEIKTQGLIDDAMIIYEKYISEACGLFLFSFITDYLVERGRSTWVLKLSHPLRDPLRIL